MSCNRYHETRNYGTVRIRQEEKRQEEAEPAVGPVDEDKVAAAEANAATAKAERGSRARRAGPANTRAAASEGPWDVLMRQCPIMTIIWIWAPTRFLQASSCVSRPATRHPASAWFHHHLRLSSLEIEATAPEPWDCGMTFAVTCLKPTRPLLKWTVCSAPELKLPVNVRERQTVVPHRWCWMAHALDAGVASSRQGCYRSDSRNRALNKFFSIVVQAWRGALAPRDLVDASAGSLLLGVRPPRPRPGCCRSPRRDAALAALRSAGRPADASGSDRAAQAPRHAR